jgi:hypothetical protein
MQWYNSYGSGICDISEGSCRTVDLWLNYQAWEQTQGSSINNVAQSTAADALVKQTAFGPVSEGTGDLLTNVYAPSLLGSIVVNMAADQGVGYIADTLVDTNGKQKVLLGKFGFNESVQLPTGQHNVLVSYLDQARDIISAISLVGPLVTLSFTPGGNSTYQNQPPTAGFLMSGGGSNTARNGQTLSVNVGSGGPASILVDGRPPYSTDPDGTIASCEWRIDGSLQADNRCYLGFVMNVGTHTITLAVTDNLGSGSAAVSGTVLVTQIVSAPLTWNQKFPTNSPPSALYQPAIAYDAARGQTVLFGAAFGNNAVSNTWVWDGITWTQKVPATSPPPRSGPSMVYDSIHQQVVLFGGGVADSQGRLITLSDTWVWDGNNWSQQTPVTSPPARWQAAMAYDSRRGRAVLFGGGIMITSTFCCTTAGDTWEWDGTNWILQTPLSSPSSATDIAAIYDEAQQTTILFAGNSNAGFPTPGSTSETWFWDGTNWTKAINIQTPLVRMTGGMAYDVSRQQAVLVGFSCFTCTPQETLTYVWDGSNWSMIIGANTPTLGSSVPMANDIQRSRVVMLVPPQASTWVWPQP